MKRATVCLLFALLLAPSLYASDRYDPRLRFRTIATPHFDVHHHQGEERLARRVAELAEAIASELAPRMGRARARVHVILVDQTDLANGWATPLPYNLIEIVAASPRHDSVIGNTNDWLRLVLTHEYTHVVHLERSRGLLGAVGRVFGRNPFFYPNLFTPPWQIEGLATFFESARFGDGRIPAGDFRMVMTASAAARRFPTLDRASNDIVQWPGGQTRYLYGGYFHQYLAETYGEQSLARLADATAARLPYLGSRAFSEVFGKSLGTLWKEFEASVSTAGRVVPAGVQRLTHHGFEVADPWFAPDGRLFYAIANPHGFPALMKWDAASVTRVTSRVGGEQLTSAADGRIFFDQVEYVRSVGLQSDLYVRSPDGHVRRLTRQARAADPDASPDGSTLVCVIQKPEGRALATVPSRGGMPTVLLFEPGVDYASPRWSPDGRRIVVERQALLGMSEIVVLDAATGAISALVTASPRGRNATPIWSRDGQQILFASDRDGGAFRIFAFDVASRTLRRLGGVESAQAPTLSPDGSNLVFVGYTPAGYDLFSLPLSGARWEAASNEVPTSPAVAAQLPPITSLDDQPYSPWTTLLPRFWTPIIEEDGDDVAVGGATTGADALGRHAYYASAAWSTRGRPDWSASYAYDRWRPTFFAEMSDDQERFREGDIRVREVNAGALLSFRRVRRTQTVAGAFHAAHEELDCSLCEPSTLGQANRRALRAGYVFDTARGFGYSISDEEGLVASLSAEWTGASLGADGDATAVIADVRGYRRAGPRHAVIAVRVAGAHAGGDESVGRVFSAGGANAPLPFLDFGFGAIGLVRGFDASDIGGRSALVANVDYRAPLMWIERGVGTWPLFLRSVHGAVFADAGSAWDTRRTRDDWRTAIGAELSADVVVGYALPVTLTAGVAARNDPTRRAHGLTLFGRVGRSF